MMRVVVMKVAKKRLKNHQTLLLILILLRNRKNHLRIKKLNLHQNLSLKRIVKRNLKKFKKRKKLNNRRNLNLKKLRKSKRLKNNLLKSLHLKVKNLKRRSLSRVLNLKVSLKNLILIVNRNLMILKNLRKSKSNKLKLNLYRLRRFKLDNHSNKDNKIITNREMENYLRYLSDNLILRLLNKILKISLKDVAMLHLLSFSEMMTEDLREEDLLNSLKNHLLLKLQN